MALPEPRSRSSAAASDEMEAPVANTSEAPRCAALIGPYLSGKTTLLELICGLQTPDGGSVRSDPAVLMPQRDLLLPWLCAIDNAALALRIHGIARDEARAAAHPWFERFGLAGFERATPAELSGGMRQRVSFLRSLLADLDVNPGTAWLVGNSIPSDINPALACGMHAIWIDAHVWGHERREAAMWHSEGFEDAARLTDVPEVKAEPVRHPGNWIGALVVLVLAAMLGHTLVVNRNFHWDVVGAYFLSGQMLGGLLRTLELTALAMVIGMVPMAIGLGEGGEQNAPLGRAVIGGLMFATVTTLFIVPVIYTWMRSKPPVDHEQRLKEREREAGVVHHASALETI